MLIYLFDCASFSLFGGEGRVEEGCVGRGKILRARCSWPFRVTFFRVFSPGTAVFLPLRGHACSAAASAEVPIYAVGPTSLSC